MHTININLPDGLYLRLQHAARATGQSFDDILLRAVKLGSPPSWDDVPAMFQQDLAALDRLDDQSLWDIAKSRQTQEDVKHYHVLLEANAQGKLSKEEKVELERLRVDSDRFMLKKAQAATLLQWRGHTVPPADKL